VLGNSTTKIHIEKGLTLFPFQLSLNFGYVSRLANLNLIPKFDLVRGSKCQVCVQFKQPRKPHKTAEVRNLAPLDLYIPIYVR
jgi:hypothetical protein